MAEKINLIVGVNTSNKEVKETVKKAYENLELPDGITFQSMLEMSGYEMTKVLRNRLNANQHENAEKFLKNQKEYDNYYNAAEKLEMQCKRIIKEDEEFDLFYDKTAVKKLTKFSWKEFNEFIETLKAFRLVKENSSRNIIFTLDKEKSDLYLVEEIEEKAKEFEKYINVCKKMVKNKEIKDKLKSLERKLKRTEF